MCIAGWALNPGYRGCDVGRGPRVPDEGWEGSGRLGTSQEPGWRRGTEPTPQLAAPVPAQPRGPLTWLQIPQLLEMLEMLRGQGPAQPRGQSLEPGGLGLALLGLGRSRGRGAAGGLVPPVLGHAGALPSLRPPREQLGGEEP